MAEPKNEAFELIKIRERSGGITKVFGSASQSIGSARSNGDGVWTIYTTCQVFQVPAPGQPPTPIGGYAPFVRVKWGSEGGAPQRAVVNAGRRVCVVASRVDVEGYVVAADGTGAPANVYGEFSTTIAQGSDGMTILPSVWTPLVAVAPGPEGVLASGGGALKTVAGFNAGAVEATLMFFDAPPGATIADGTRPIAALLAGPTDNFEGHFGDGRPFASGLVWRASSTRGALTYLAGAVVRVDAEIVTL
jgi:hypothetical protein